MAKNCAVCDMACVFKRRPNVKEGEIFGAPCDRCHQFNCKDCADLSSTEADAVVVQKRSLLFLCKGCKTDFTDVAHLSNKYDQLRNEITQKNNYISILEADLEDLKSTLSEEITRLSKDNQLKDDHIKRLRKRSQNFDADVVEAGKNYESTVQSQKLEIDRIERELADQLKANYNLSEEIKGHLVKIETVNVELDKLNVELDKLKDLNNKLLNDISSLTKENIKYAQNLGTNKDPIERTSLIERIDVGLQTDTSYHNPYSKKSTVSAEASNESKNRVLLLCDQMGSGLDVKLNQVLDQDQYMVQSVIKPFALLRDIIENISAFVRDFDKDDYVIVFAGYNDFSASGSPNFSLVLNKLKECVHTNVIVLSVPIHHKYVNKCYSFNSKLDNLMYRLDKFSSNKVSFINTCNNLGRKHTNRRISGLILNQIKCSGSKNLTFVMLHENINYTNDNCSMENNKIPSTSSVTHSLLNDGFCENNSLSGFLLDISPSDLVTDTNFQQELSKTLVT